MTDSKLKQKLRDDLTTSIKARDSLTSSTLRMVITAISNEEVAGTESRTLTDDDVLKVLTKEGKKRRESAEAFTNANRPELAQKEIDELKVIDAYLPEQLGEAEIVEVVKAAVAESGASGMQDMGKVMKLVQPQLAGRADGRLVADTVKSQLS